MLRSDFINAVNAIRRDMAQTKAKRVLMVAARPGMSNSIEHNLPFEVYRNVVEAFAKYDEQELAVVGALKLGNLTSPEIWSFVSRFGDKSRDRKVLDSDRKMARQISDLIDILDYLENNLVSLIAILERIPDQTADSVPKKHKDLKVLLVENLGEVTAPSRIARLMQSVESMYSSLAELEKIDPSTLQVTSIDSGSDKAFDFLGVGKIIQQLKEIILVIFEQKRANSKLERVALIDQIERSIPVLSSLVKAEKDGIIEPEDAARLKHGILSGIDKFIDVGATIPEMDELAGGAPRIAMKPVTKLIEGPKRDSDKKKKKKKPKST